MGGGHPGLAAIAARTEVSPINRRIVFTARPFCRSRILEHARPDRGLCTAARFSSFATSLPPQSITRSQPARASPPGKRRFRIFPGAPSDCRATRTTVCRYRLQRRLCTVCRWCARNRYSLHLRLARLDASLFAPSRSGTLWIRYRLISLGAAKGSRAGSSSDTLLQRQNALA